EEDESRWNCLPADVLEAMDALERLEAEPPSLELIAEGLALEGADFEAPALTSGLRYLALDVWDVWHFFDQRPVSKSDWIARFRRSAQGVSANDDSDARQWERFKARLRRHRVPHESLEERLVALDVETKRNPVHIRLLPAARKWAEFICEFADEERERFRQARARREAARKRSSSPNPDDPGPTSGVPLRSLEAPERDPNRLPPAAGRLPGEVAPDGAS